MALFKIRQLAYSETAVGSRRSCIAVLLFDAQDRPIDVITLNDAREVLRQHPKADVEFLAALLDELRVLRHDPDAIGEYVTTRLSEASLSLVLEEPKVIEGADEHAARSQSAEYLLVPPPSKDGRGED